MSGTEFIPRLESRPQPAHEADVWYETRLAPACRALPLFLPGQVRTVQVQGQGIQNVSSQDSLVLLDDKELTAEYFPK